jgi:UPF0148 protein
LSEQSMKEMAEMIRQGAKMLSSTCPQCGAPLFQLKTGETYCPQERREVKVVKDGKDPQKVAQDASLERTLQTKLQLLQHRLDAETEPTEIRKLTETIITLLEAQRSLKPVNETK